MWYFPHCQRTKLSMSHGSHGLFYELFNNPSHLLDTYPLTTGYASSFWMGQLWVVPNEFFLLLLDSKSPSHPILEKRRVELCPMISCIVIMLQKRLASLAPFLWGCCSWSRGLAFVGLLPRTLRGPEVYMLNCSLRKAFIFKN